MDITSSIKRLFAKKTDKQDYSADNENMLIEREFIKYSPFEAIRHENSGWFAVFGKQKITNEYKTKKDLLNQFEGINWEILLNAVAVMTKAVVKDELKQTAEELVNEFKH